MYVSVQTIADRWENSTATVWRRLRTDPTFPRPVKLSPGCTRWKLSEIEAYEAAQAELSNQERVG